MNVVLLAAAYLSSPAQAPEPVFWMKLDGSIQVYAMPLIGGSRPAPRLLAPPPRLREGTSVVRVPGGIGYDFDGKVAGIMLDDTPSLALTYSMSVSCWLKPRSYVNRGPAAQILFRGDDRGGLDPYQLLLQGDGTIHFSVHNEDNVGVTVVSPIAIDRWTHVLATLDSRQGVLAMWINGEKVTMALLKGIRPLGPLDRGSAAGVGIGNVQNDKGPHNQPFNGTIADLRIYDWVVTPQEAGFGTEGWHKKS